LHMGDLQAPGADVGARLAGDRFAGHVLRSPMLTIDKDVEDTYADYDNLRMYFCNRSP
jgi:hypothetical protein